MTDAKLRTRHPSANIPLETVDELNFRLYLSRLEPPMTPEQSAQSVYVSSDRHGKPVTQDDASRRRQAKHQLALTRDFLRIAVDMHLIARSWPDPQLTEENAQ